MEKPKKKYDIKKFERLVKKWRKSLMIILKKYELSFEDFLIIKNRAEEEIKKRGYKNLNEKGLILYNEIKKFKQEKKWLLITEKIHN